MFSILLSILAGALRIAGCLLCLGALTMVRIVAPYVRPLLWRLTLLGTWFSLFFELIARVPNFPFWSVMQIFIACAALLGVDRAVGAYANNSANN